MKYALIVGLTSALLASTATADNIQTIHIAAPSYWCPYACSADQTLKGFAIDITIAAFKAVGIDVNYSNAPYDRALIDVKSGKLDGVGPTFQKEAPGFVFPTHAISTTQYCFYTAHSSWQYTGIESLEDVRFSATSGYAYSPKMDQYIANQKNKNVSLLRGEDIPNRMYQMLKTKRIDAILDDTRIIEYMMSTKEITSRLKQAGCLDSLGHGYLALSPRFLRRSLFLAEQFDIGYTKIKTQGKVAKILKRYGITSK